MTEGNALGFGFWFVWGFLPRVVPVMCLVDLTQMFISVFALKLWNFSAPGRISNQMLWLQEATFFPWIILCYIYLSES